jgi:ABC-type multidrug transport system permease subunit
MKKKEVIIGIVISTVVFLSTVIIHSFIFELPHVLATSLITFSALLFVLCIFGNKKRMEREENHKTDGK